MNKLTLPFETDLEKPRRGAKENPAEAGFSVPSGMPQSFSAADMRAMKLSNVPSHTRNHRISSLRKAFHES
jgi:hypothetical protein